MSEDDISYEKAREYTLEKWKTISEGKNHGSTPNVTLTNQCGFCEYFLDNRMCGCPKCPLFDPEQTGDEESAFSRRVSLPCSKHFWKWSYYRREGSVKKALKEAKLLYELIKKSPEHEGE